MHLVCPHCQQQLEYLDSPPRFCSFCGHSLGNGKPPLTVDLVAEAATLPPPTAATETQVPSAYAEPTQEGMPEAIGNFRLVRPLGGGGMGTVYEAIAASSGQRVALKLISPEYASSKESVERFRQEGQLASKLAHPRCVFVLAADEDCGRPYIVMELMSGATLNDLVKKNGPLAPELAIRKMLDVIEGLHEAHQFGLVHRDVKPGNCFLEPDGRVKIGDFGLAKSLLRDSHLTRTGTFLGTPLFAAPEQIKREAVDLQSDVYSVAATLYFLLTGQAPFQSNDSMATMARIVSDDPPSMRSLRPELPKKLDEVVLRGLARERKNRWRSLEEFRQPLVHLLPAQVSVGGLGLRLGAYMIDVFLLTLVGQLIGEVLLFVFAGDLVLEAAAILGFQTALHLAYFGVLEGRRGWSLGKRLLRLRVGRTDANQDPGLGRAFLRAAILYMVPNLLPELASLYVAVYLPEAVQITPSGVQASASGAPVDSSITLSILLGSTGLWYLLALVGLFSTVRQRNGYRGLHELLSGTRTYRLRWPAFKRRRTLDTGHFQPEITQPDDLPDQVGPYRIRGALRWTPTEKSLLGQDTHLGRAVWISLRPQLDPPLHETERAVNRMTRLRWVACGSFESYQWDAFLAPSGCPLPALVADNGPLSWTEFRPLLEELTEELRASCRDQTLPGALSPEQVWIGPKGQMQLLARKFLDARDSAAGIEGDKPPADEDARALAFLGTVAALAFEGKPRPVAGQALPIQAPLPLHAARLVNRLLAADQPAFDRVDKFQAELQVTREEPTEISRWARARHLIGQGVFAALAALGALTILGLVAGSGLLQGEDRVVPVAVCVLELTLFFLPAYLTRGGLSFLRAGIAIVLQDGRQASRLRGLARSLAAWAVVAVLGGVYWIGAAGLSRLPWADWIAFGTTYYKNDAGAVWADTLPWGEWLAGGITALLFAGYLFLMIRSPARAPHDYLTQTYLVPK
jgi:hypothetical protein